MSGEQNQPFGKPLSSENKAGVHQIFDGWWLRVGEWTGRAPRRTFQ